MRVGAVKVVGAGLEVLARKVGGRVPLERVERATESAATYVSDHTEYKFVKKPAIM